MGIQTWTATHFLIILTLPFTKYNLNFQKIYDAINLRLGKEAKLFELNQINDKELKRKLKSISQIGTSVLEGDDLNKYTSIVNEMEKIYSTSKVQDFKDKSRVVSLEPEITLRMAESRNPKELEYYWTKHREVTGSKMRDMYKEYIKLTNKAAR